MSNWVHNSFAKSISSGALQNHLSIIAICVSLFIDFAIIIHSWSIHGYPKRIRNIWDLFPKSTRSKTEVASASTIMSAIFIIIGSATTNETVYIVFSNCLRSGFMGVIQQLCDSYMFFDRLQAVVKLPPWKRFLIHAYIWIVLVLTWTPAYSIIPFFYNTNSKTFSAYFTIANAVYCFGIVAYDTYISAECVIMLYSIHRRVNTTMNPAIVKTMMSIALRSIGHAVTSSLAAMAYLFAPVPIGAAVYGIVIPLGMHFWFNSNWWLWKKPFDGFHMTRPVREKLANIGKLSTIVRQLRLVAAAASSSSSAESATASASATAVATATASASVSATAPAAAAIVGGTPGIDKNKEEHNNNPQWHTNTGTMGSTIAAPKKPIPTGGLLNINRPISARPISARALLDFNRPISTGGDFEDNISRPLSAKPQPRPQPIMMTMPDSLRVEPGSRHQIVSGEEN